MTIEVALFGTLGRDCERKTSKNGKPYLRLNVACGEGDATQWVSVTCFDPRAIENAASFIKGARVYVEGTLSLDKWTGQDGTERPEQGDFDGHDAASRRTGGILREASIIVSKTPRQLPSASKAKNSPFWRMTVPARC